VEPVTLQISIAPPDLRYARPVVEHQLRVFGEQVDEILLTPDTRRSRGRRFGAAWGESAGELGAFLSELERAHPRVRVLPVDYRRSVSRKVAERFFARRRIPAKDFRGGPFYTYFFALWAARHNLVLHVDCDMLFGGGSRTWVADAVELLRSRDDVLAVCPLPGPQTADGSLRDQDPYGPRREGRHAFSFGNFTSRVFLLDRERLRPVPLWRIPGWKGRLWGELRRQPSYALPEVLISELMCERRWVRHDFLGSPPGLWSVHPIEHDEDFRGALPRLIEQVERGELPEAQAGRYNLHPDTIGSAA
jgi:hypothetical protein